MNISEYRKNHWKYYKMLEEDFRNLERYIAFDFGTEDTINSETNTQNSACTSFELIKQHGSICAEFETLCKSFCFDLFGKRPDKILNFFPPIQKKFPGLKNQKIEFNNEYLLIPFDVTNGIVPFWWTPHNRVKHDRVIHLEKSNLKNVLFSLAGLYTLNRYYAKFIGERNNSEDSPNGRSKIFDLLNFKTNFNYVSDDLRTATREEVIAALREGEKKVK